MVEKDMRLAASLCKRVQPSRQEVNAIIGIQAILKLSSHSLVQSGKKHVQLNFEKSTRGHEVGKGQNDSPDLPSKPSWFVDGSSNTNAADWM